MEQDLVDSLFNEDQIEKHRQDGFVRMNKLLPISVTDEELERKDLAQLLLDQQATIASQSKNASQRLASEMNAASETKQIEKQAYELSMNPK